MAVQSSNGRIAKNTVMLYVRMIVLMAVSLYTSRVILDVLGVNDYGLYNVVGGIVTIFTFLSSAMGYSTQRFITYALGENDTEKLKKIFNTTCLIHWGLAIIILIFAETAGLWFLENKIVIPPDRMDACRWVYQFSIIACMISVISIPYNSLVIAHEKMGAFAMLSIIYATAKLIIVFIVKYSSYDQLILYAALLLMVQISDRLMYQFYCKRLFPESRKISFRKTVQVKEMTTLAGWSLLPSLATVSYTQGINILLNLFFGPEVNAARGVSVQVQGVIKNFVTNFQTAVSPQIIKTYASGEKQRFLSLIFSSSKLSYYLLLCMALPVILEADFLLSLWLKVVPEHTVSFLRLIILAIVLDPLSNPICVANNATGDVKRFKIVEASICLTIIPFSYLMLKIGAPPESVFFVQIVLSVIVQFARVTIVKGQLGFSYREYWHNILSYVLKVSIVSSLIPFALYWVMPHALWYNLLIMSVSFISVLLCSYLIGLTKGERLYFKNKFLSRFKKI